MRIISIYLLLLGWTSAFALHPWVPLPMMLSIIMFVLSFFLILKNNSIKGLDKQMMTLFYLFILTMLISFVFQVFTIGFRVTGFTHVLSYIGVILAYFIGVVTFIESTQYPTEKVYKYISWGVMFVAFITIVEFISRNFFNLEFDILGIGRENIATYSVGGERFLRSRGTTVESGHLAMYLLMFVPFVYHYQMIINKDKKKTALSLSVIILAVLLTFSAAGFVELAVASIIIIVLILRKSLRRGFKLSRIVLIYPIIFVILSCGVYYFAYAGGNLSFLAGVMDKVFLSNYAIDDGGSRLARWYRAWELFKESPIIGHGAGISSIAYGTGSTSFYLEILVETGLIGLGILLAIMVYHFKLILKLQENIKYVYLISFITMTIHLAVISDYWYPWMWTLFALINIQFHRQKRELKKLE